jgi:hypothetical protein
MPYERSLNDQYSESLAELERLKANLATDLSGTQANVLRITTIPTGEELPGKSYDVFGYSEKTLSSWAAQTIGNVGLVYPRGAMEVFEDRVNQSSTSVGIDIDFFPITMQISTESVITNFTDDPIILKQGDLIVDYFVDENKNVLPIIMKLERLRRPPWGKQLVTKSYELSIVFGKQPIEIEDKIREWIDGLDLDY